MCVAVAVCTKDEEGGDMHWSRITGWITAGLFTLEMVLRLVAAGPRKFAIDLQNLLDVAAVAGNQSLAM